MGYEYKVTDHFHHHRGGLRGRCGNSSDHFRQVRIIVACIIRTKGKERFKSKRVTYWPTVHDQCHLLQQTAMSKATLWPTTFNQFCVHSQAIGPQTNPMFVSYMCHYHNYNANNLTRWHILIFIYKSYSFAWVNLKDMFADLLTYWPSYRCLSCQNCKHKLCSVVIQPF